MQDKVDRRDMPFMQSRTSQFDRTPFVFKEGVGSLVDVRSTPQSNHSSWDGPWLGHSRRPSGTTTSVPARRPSQTTVSDMWESATVSSLCGSPHASEQTTPMVASPYMSEQDAAYVYEPTAALPMPPGSFYQGTVYGSRCAPPTPPGSFTQCNQRNVGNGNGVLARHWQKTN